MYNLDRLDALMASPNSTLDRSETFSYPFSTATVATKRCNISLRLERIEVVRRHVLAFCRRLNGKIAHHLTVWTLASCLTSAHRSIALAVQPLVPDEAWDPKKQQPVRELKEFLVANRLHGGERVMNLVTSLQLKAMSQGDR